MGTSQSKPDTRPKVFQPETSIEISPDVVNNLSARLASEETMPERQFAVDFHVRERIQRELTVLRAEEETVQLEIHRALEKENLDREISMVEDGSTHGGLKTGVALIGDLEEIREKVDRFQTRRQLGDFPSVKETGEAIASCYKINPTTPLECWREVARFKAAVADAETVRESLEPNVLVQTLTYSYFAAISHLVAMIHSSQEFLDSIINDP